MDMSKRDVKMSATRHPFNLEWTCPNRDVKVSARINVREPNLPKRSYDLISLCLTTPALLSGDVDDDDEVDDDGSGSFRPVMILLNKNIKILIKIEGPRNA